MDDDRLAGSHVIVTGGARGIGRGVATRVARAGADVSVFDTDTEGAAETAARVREAGGDAVAVEVDVADVGDIDRGLSTAVDELGTVHGLVNNAGVQRSVPVLESTTDDWDFHVDVNARGEFFCAQRVAEHMVENDVAGAVVNVASTAAERPLAGQGTYAASKSAVVGFTTVMAQELGEHGITVNAINPGTVDTPMVRAWAEENAERTGVTVEEMLQEAVDLHILDRIGRPEEIGHVATLLLSAEGDWITGEVVNVDGGQTSK
jgi:3-oxoacyl-[acyl-carrier protein] reductase/meso-butanediol dehydrogenase/(S,S)-butanediol dehydrogenase/diacetyl reductase